MAFSQNQNQTNKHGKMFLSPDEQEWSQPLRSMALWQRINIQVADYGKEFLPGRYMRVRFEDLCSTPVPIIQRIFDFFGLHGDAKTIAEAEIGVPLSSGRWRREDSETTDILYGIGEQALKKFGYLTQRETNHGNAKNPAASRIRDMVCVLASPGSEAAFLAMALSGSHDDSLSIPKNLETSGPTPRVWNLNNKILAAFQGSWDEPPSFPNDWESSPRLKKLMEEARQLILEEFADAAAPALLLPFPCSTLPFWQKIFSSMRYIICLADPVKVAHELTRSEGFSFAKGIYLWLVQAKIALEYTSGQPCCLVRYEDLANNEPGELLRLGKFLGAPEIVRQLDLQSPPRESLDQEDGHWQAAATDDNNEQAACTALARALHGALCLYTRHDSDRTPESQASLNDLCHAVLIAAAALRQSTAQLACERRLRNLSGEENVRLRADLDSEGRNQAANAELVSRLTEEAQRSSEIVKGLQATVASLRTDIQKYAKQVSELQAAQSGLLWDVLTAYRRTKDRLFPLETKRRSAYDACLGIVKRLKGG